MIDDKTLDAMQSLRRSIEELSHKLDSYTGICEAVLDEVVPMSLAIDKLIEAGIKETMD